MFPGAKTFSSYLRSDRRLLRCCTDFQEPLQPLKVFPFTLTVCASTSTVTISPPSHTSWMPSQVRRRMPLLNALRKKILAKAFGNDRANTIIGKNGSCACSRLEPRPKLVPATRISPGWTVEPNSGFQRSSKHISSFHFDPGWYLFPGIMVSVSISFPNFQIFPLNFFSITASLHLLRKGKPS